MSKIHLFIIFLKSIMKKILILCMIVYLTLQIPPPNSILEVTSNDGLNIRATPCTNGRIITALARGVRVNYNNKHHKDCGYDWLEVRGCKILN